MGVAYQLSHRYSEPYLGIITANIPCIKTVVEIVFRKLADHNTLINSNQQHAIQDGRTHSSLTLHSIIQHPIQEKGIGSTLNSDDALLAEVDMYRKVSDINKDNIA
jgi:hypothetical protein